MLVGIRRRKRRSQRCGSAVQGAPARGAGRPRPAPALCAVPGRAAPGGAESGEASPLCSPFGGGALPETTEHQLNAGLQPSSFFPSAEHWSSTSCPIMGQGHGPTAQSPSPAPIPSPKPSFILSAGVGYRPSEGLAPPLVLTLMRCTPLSPAPPPSPCPPVPQPDGCLPKPTGDK